MGPKPDPSAQFLTLRYRAIVGSGLAPRQQTDPSPRLVDPCNRARPLWGCTAVIVRRRSWLVKLDVIIPDLALGNLSKRELACS